MVEDSVEGYYATIFLLNLRLPPVSMQAALEQFDARRGGFCTCYNKAERVSKFASRIVNIKKERYLGFRIVCGVY